MNKMPKSLFVIIFIFLHLANANDLLLTQKEKTYIKNNIVKVALLPDFYPFSFYKNRTLRGYSYNLLKLIAKKSNLKLEFIVDTWPKNFNKFKNEQVHIIDSISYTKGRVDYTSFTKPYFEIPLVIYSRINFAAYDGTIQN